MIHPRRLLACTTLGLLLGVPLILRAQEPAARPASPPGRVHISSPGGPFDASDPPGTSPQRRGRPTPGRAISPRPRHASGEPPGGRTRDAHSSPGDPSTRGRAEVIPAFPPGSRPLRLSHNVAEETLSDGAAAAFLPPLEHELHRHGGAYLYEPLDVGAARYRPPHASDPLLRLPEDWQEPQPLSLPFDFLGSHPIIWHPKLTWCGAPGYQWEPRLVGYGSYELFGVLFEEDHRRRDGIGHQLLLDLDLALTGTERVHVQFRPLGENNTGGSFWQFSDPEGYIDNSTAIPQRWWVEGELHSLLGRLFDDPRVQLDVNVTAGKFPLVFHNFLLMNDEITGIVIGKNTITRTPLSNLNVQLFYGFDEIDAFTGRSSELAGIELVADYRLAFIEFTYAHLFDEHGSAGDADFYALSGTRFFGPLSLAARVMFKEGNATGTGDGQLYVIESNFARRPVSRIAEQAGIELAVTYINVFKATSGWEPIAGGNFDRLRNLFVLNPLLAIAAGRAPADTYGLAVGTQLFRHHEDESLIPEIAVERPAGRTVWGVGLRYQRKLTARCYLDLRGLKTWSSADELVREGVFVSTFIVF